jgi:hypothetical protein
MTSYKQLLLPAVMITCLILTACDKNDNNVDNNVVSKNGIALNAANEVQANPVVSPATGTMNVSYDKTTRQLKWDIVYSGLTDTIVASHIHGTAPKTASAGIKVPFTLPRTMAGSYSGSTIVDGVAIKEDSLLKGFYYINIHTKRYTGGEIRGQIEFN